MRQTGIGGLVCLALLPITASAQAPADSALQFVKAFYAWYVPLARESGEVIPWMRAIRERRSSFSQPIIQALRADSVATSKSPDEIVGLDGDPFLNAQDPCDRYEPSRVTQRGTSFHVDVHGMGHCSRDEAPEVIAEVAKVNGRWMFSDFRLPGSPPETLLGLLRKQATDRRRRS
jgi:hypothetical protein